MCRIGEGGGWRKGGIGPNEKASWNFHEIHTMHIVVISFIRSLIIVVDY